MTQIKEVIHLYLGCEVEVTHPAAFSRDTLDADLLGRLESDLAPVASYYKIRLRRLDSMTEEEFAEFKKYADDDAENMVLIPSMSAIGETRLFKTFNAPAYLLKQGFWLFGDEAFQQGLIIDKNLKP